MLFSSAFLAVLATMATQTGRLELTNIRPTYGALGPARSDFKITLGDTVHLAFDIVGLQTDEAGRMVFATALEVEDGKGASVFKSPPRETIQVNLFGDRTVRHTVHVITGLEQSPDRYRVKVTVQDRVGKREGSFTRDLQVTPAEFSLVRLQLAGDLEGRAAASHVATVGQPLYVNFVALGYQRDTKNNNLASISVELAILDDKGKSITPKPPTGQFKDIPPDTEYLPLRFDLPIQRPGQYRIQLKATDLVGKKTTTLVVPLTAVDAR